jgi:ribonuclease-3
MTPTDSLAALEKRLGVAFRRRSLLELAVTHRSYPGDDGVPPAVSNERLEFLGDAVLAIAVAEHLYRLMPLAPEGELTKLKAVVVSEAVLAEVARELGIGRFLRIGRGEESSGGRQRASLLSDSLEAIIGAIYLDRGMRAARGFIETWLDRRLQAAEDAPFGDAKTALQELTQDRHKLVPRYRVVDESGPDHDKTFVVEARLADEILGVGSGKSKKEAEQAAAREALRALSHQTSTSTTKTRG